MAIGPVQLVALSFDNAEIPAGVVEELRRLREAGIVRLVDAVWVAKDDQGDLVEVRSSDFDQEELDELAGLAGALFGFGVAGEDGVDAGTELGVALAETGDFGIGQDEIDEVADIIPPGTSVALLMLEHQWAQGLREAVFDGGGDVIAHGFVTPDAIIAAGEAYAAAILDEETA
jgi:uncharacterized membrane protein